MQPTPLQARYALIAALALTFALAASLTARTPEAAASTTWLCKPGLANDPCSPGLATTRVSPSGTVLGPERVRAARPRRLDCFYVYPTVSSQPTPAATKRLDPELPSVALYQAARYSQHCRVYAPVYRQITLAGIGIGASAPVTAAMRATAYGDVREAWRTYLRRYNKGRGVVLIGHSQGAFSLRELIAEEIDDEPAVRRRLVSALLLGGNVLVRKGSDAGGDFKRIRACRSARQLQCVVAFSTYGETPPANAIFGQPSRLLSVGPQTDLSRYEVLCTNPAALRGGSARLSTIYPSAPFAPGTVIGAATTAVGFPIPEVPTPWVQADAAYTGRCSSGGVNALVVTPRAGAPVLTPLPDTTWGLHLTDANIALGDLVELVRRQGEQYARR
jgi:hypothetical protein